MKDPVLEPEDAGGVGGAADHPAAHAALPRDAGRGGAQMGPQVSSFQVMFYSVQYRIGSIKQYDIVLKPSSQLSAKKRLLNTFSRFYSLHFEYCQTALTCLLSIK